MGLDSDARDDNHLGGPYTHRPHAARRTTPDVIERVGPHEIFVFGSNLAGRHGAGAARYALDHFGAQYGQGEGLQGHSYALPTLGSELEQLSAAGLAYYALRFYHTAADNPSLTFLLTKVGCGLAGYPESAMKWFFRFTPPNVVKPEGW
jgi:hypothetical protein